nr:hypothetical protein [Hartmannibacter diazotrophicus]
MNKICALIALPIILGGCGASAPVVLDGTDPSDPASGIRPLRYASPVSGYVHRVPVDPNPWRGQNDAQRPQGDGS